MASASTMQTTICMHSRYQSPSTGPALQYPTFEHGEEICLESGRYCAVTSYEFAGCCVITLACFMQTTKGGGSRAIPTCSAHHVYCQSPDRLIPR